MASAPPIFNENSSSSDTDSKSESDSESDNSDDDSETTDSLSSFDQSEEENLDIEDISDEPFSDKLPSEFEINEEKPSTAEVTDACSCDSEKSGNVLSAFSFLISSNFLLLLLFLFLQILIPHSFSSYCLSPHYHYKSTESLSELLCGHMYLSLYAF